MRTNLLILMSILFLLGAPPAEYLALGDVGLSGTPPPAAKTFTFRIRDEPETLDWNLARSLVEAHILTNLMEGLVTFDSDSKVQPALAQNWTISPDGKTYTFTLRSGVKWSDGVLLRAQDFVYSWKRLLSRLTAAPYAYFLFDIVGAEAYNKGEILSFDKVGVRAVNDLTLEVKLTHPVAHWINIPGFWVTFPLRQDVVEKYGVGWDKPGQIVTLGPYTFESHDIGSKIVMRANPNYFGTMGNISEVVALIVKDDAAAFKMYEAGKLDFLSDLILNDIKNLAGRPDFRIFSQLKTVFLGFFTEHFPSSNLKFRKAIAMAIDKSKIKDLLFGNHLPARSFVPPPIVGYSQEVGLAYDPKKAKKELLSSGIDPSGLTLTYLLPDWDKSALVAQFVQSEVERNLGVSLKLQRMANKTYRTQMSLHNSPLYDFSWTADYPDPDNFLSLFLSGSGNNHSSWKNAQFDQMVLRARWNQNPVERLKLYRDLQKIILEDEALIVPLYYEPNLALVRPRVKSLELNSLGYLYLRRVNVGS